MITMSVKGDKIAITIYSYENWPKFVQNFVKYILVPIAFSVLANMIGLLHSNKRG